jgi:hypothetical protein
MCLMSLLPDGNAATIAYNCMCKQQHVEEAIDFNPLLMPGPPGASPMPQPCCFNL